MKSKKIIFVTLFILSAFLAIQSCKKEDTTVIVKQAFTKPGCTTTPEVRGDGTILFTGTTVDLSWASENKDVNPVKWDVYFGNGKAPALYQAGLTTNTITVPVFDGLTYYWKVEIADSKGIVTTSDINTFIAVDGSSAKMKLNLIAETDILTSIGLDMAAADVIDLILIIYDKSDMSVVEEIDMGTSDEEFSDFHNLPDGEYVIGVDYYSAKTFGSVNKPLSVSLKLKFAQLGFINETLEFPGVIDNWSAQTPPTSGYLITYLAEFTKTGPRYTITKAVSSDLDLLKGPWIGDDALYESVITCRRSGATMVLDSIGKGWMEDWWAEEITAATPTKIYFDWKNKTVYFPQQTYVTTRYWDPTSLPPAYVYTNYTIKLYGTVPHTFDMTGPYPVVKLRYDILNGTTSIGSTAYALYGWPTKYFQIDITLDPAAKGGVKSVQIDRPKRIR